MEQVEKIKKKLEERIAQIEKEGRVYLEMEGIDEKFTEPLSPTQRVRLYGLINANVRNELRDILDFIKTTERKKKVTVLLDATGRFKLVDLFTHEVIATGITNRDTAVEIAKTNGWVLYCLDRKFIEAL